MKNPQSSASPHPSSFQSRAAARATAFDLDADAAPNLPGLFLASSNIREIDSDAACLGPATVPLDDGRWLLRNVTTRKQGWHRLDTAAVHSPSITLRPYYAALKRILDVTASLILLVLLSPAFVLIAILVMLDSPGPALFRQRRIGRNGACFLIWKFRSMRTDAPKYARSPTSNLDERITRIGRILRRISLDELPQLINVLRGEMSLVGPRPEMPFIVNRYSQLELSRLAVKPGMTGLWQISPGRAYPIHENLQYDLHYIRHRNLLLDAAILLRTVAAVIGGVGAV